MSGSYLVFKKLGCFDVRCKESSSLGRILMPSACVPRMTRYTRTACVRPDTARLFPQFPGRRRIVLMTGIQSETASSDDMTTLHLHWCMLRRMGTELQSQDSTKYSHRHFTLCLVPKDGNRPAKSTFHNIQPQTFHRVL